MKTSPIRDIVFILLTLLLILAVVFAALHSPFDKPSPSQTRAATPTATSALPTPTPTPTVPPVAASLNVSGTQWGYSSCFIGATEGSSRFAIADMQDLGINVYHIYGSMDRWEAQDDSKVYGTPTIAQIQTNPNVINWSHWDSVMSNPAQGSDYSWTNNPPTWQGNAHTIFSELQAAGIRVIVDLRNRNDQNQPKWAPDPPVTTADWNEWWEHVFALVYWLNVRNHYNINDFEIHNEPDLHSQGWHGTEAQYEMFVQYTYSAINYVYKTYLPGRSYHLYGPASLTLSKWPLALMQQGIIDSIDIHDYAPNVSSYAKRVHSWMDANGYANAPLWFSEWGTYKPDAYSSEAFGISLLNNSIRESSPGNQYVYGSAIFALYDYGATALGLISAQGEKRIDYYALRMGIRALQGCRPTYQSRASNADLLAITTRNKDGSYSLLVTNQSSQKPYLVDASLSALMQQGTGSIQRFDAQNLDTNAGTTPLIGGHALFTIPPNGAILLTFSKAAA